MSYAYSSVIWMLELTYIIVAILYQECHPLAIHVRVASSMAQPVPGLSNILE